MLVQNLVHWFADNTDSECYLIERSVYCTNVNKCNSFNKPNSQAIHSVCMYSSQNKFKPKMQNTMHTNLILLS